MESTITIKNGDTTLFGISVAGLPPAVKNTQGEVGLFLSAGANPDGHTMLCFIHGPPEELLELSNAILESCLAVLRSKQKPEGD